MFLSTLKFKILLCKDCLQNVTSCCHYHYSEIFFIDAFNLEKDIVPISEARNKSKNVVLLMGAHSLFPNFNSSCWQVTK